MTMGPSLIRHMGSAEEISKKENLKYCTTLKNIQPKISFEYTVIATRKVILVIEKKIYK